MTYLLDANVFIQAKNLHYGFDFCPAFWEWIDKNNTEGRIYNIEKVGDEIQAGDDDLAEWAKQKGSKIFLSPDEKLIPSLAKVSEWVTGQGYDPAGVSNFLQVADYYLVSHAHAHNLTVVTHEIPANTVKRVKIPNVCIGLKVKYVTPYAMLRREKAKFILGKGK